MAASLSHVSLPVTALLESRLRAREVLRLKVGDVLSLGVSVKAPVKVRVANRIKYLGRLSLKEERAAVVLERIAPAGGSGELR